MSIEDDFNIESISEDIFNLINKDNNSIGDFDDYWVDERNMFQSKGIPDSQIIQLKGLVLGRLEELFEKE